MKKNELLYFLISKINIDTNKFINTIKDKLDPTKRSISIKVINDTIECLCYFKNLYIWIDSSKIIDYLKELDVETIKKYESYSKKYPSIIELDIKNEKDVFEKIYQIIQDTSLIFKLENEDFWYKINSQNNPIDIKDLKNKIKIQPKNTIKENKEKEKDENKNDEKFETKNELDLYEVKCDKWCF